MKHYTVASEEGAQRYGGEIGDQVTLALNEDEERAVLAAGWITHDPKKKEAK